MADLDRITKILDGTPYMRRKQADLLVDLFSRLKPVHVVEIGTYHGAGTCYLAELCAEYGGHVTTIDLLWTFLNDDHEPKAEDLVEKCGLTNVTVVNRDDGAEGWFRDYYADVLPRPPLDFVYCDGGHRWAEVVAQFTLAYRALRPGGWIVFDDLKNDVYPDVDLAWERIIRPGAFHSRVSGTWGFAMRGEHG